MANTKREKLFTEFPPVPTEKWEEVITADLKGAVFWARRQASSRTSEVRAATIAGACIRPSR